MDQYEAVTRRFAKALRLGLLKKFGKVPSTSEIAERFNQQAIGTKGISRETVRRWLRGLSYPETDRLQLLLDWLELNPADILIDSRTQKPSPKISPETGLVKSERQKAMFAQQALDALSAQVAILDSDGKIVQVNQAWLSFSRTTDADAVLFIEKFPNYLDVCDRVRGRDKRIASAMAAGIRAVLGGTIGEFAMKYPCHSPTQKRWFVARATGFVVKGKSFAVVSHEAVSEENWRRLRFPALALK
jgi:PAS domain-containing protein